MREPDPTLSEQWSSWDAEPRLPPTWPGLEDDRHAEGFHIDRKGVKSVAGRITNLALRGYPFWHGDMGRPDMHWALPRELSALFNTAEYYVHDFWSDLHTEIGMAGMLIERAATRYDLAENPELGDIPLDQLDDRLVSQLKGDPPADILHEPSDLYPNVSVSLELPKGISYGVDNMTADKLKEDLGHLDLWIDTVRFEERAESLVELAHLIRLRAQDLNDAPWYGEAAAKAQGALRQIYGNITSLAAVCGRIAAAARWYEQIAAWCKENFVRLADPDRGGWDEFWDFGGTPGSRTRDFLEEPNNGFMQVYELMPKRISMDLPGLLVDDAGLAEMRRMVRWVETRPKETDFLKENDAGWLEWHKPRLPAYEEAERRYG
ncbi:hypothetical protein [Nonomuraea sp. NPDC049309]|uniref:hypothetical protein n=1 Tax=Nonomuraea sp. NPDC049309 TaxID=3364350 RepID=UPI0037132580